MKLRQPPPPVSPKTQMIPSVGIVCGRTCRIYRDQFLLPISKSLLLSCPGLLPSRGDALLRSVRAAISPPPPSFLTYRNSLQIWIFLTLIQICPPKFFLRFLLSSECSCLSVSLPQSLRHDEDSWSLPSPTPSILWSWSVPLSLSSLFTCARDGIGHRPHSLFFNLLSFRFSVFKGSLL